VNRLAILGASGHGKVVADAAESSGWREVVFFDDAWPSLLQNAHWAIVGDTAALIDQISNFDGVIVAIGNNKIRQEKLAMLEHFNAPMPVILHPSAQVSRYARLGEGTVVFASAVVNADTAVGAGCIINTGAVVEHDCELGACVHVSPNASLAGGVRVGDRSWVGLGVCVKQLLTIGKDTVIGMGAVVTRNIPNDVVATGNPARRR